eukprot:g4534.t1
MKILHKKQIMGHSNRRRTTRNVGRSRGPLCAAESSRRDSGHLLAKYAVTERNILSFVEHPFIMTLHYAFQTSQHLVMVLELCNGGTLHSLIAKLRKLPECLARIYTAQILLALEYLHERGILYRDLKPENVVLDARGHAYLTDFGLSLQFPVEKLVEVAAADGDDAGGSPGKSSSSCGLSLYSKCQSDSFCGSVAYLAPEMLQRKGHSFALDIYGLGGTLFEMLVGKPPFYTRDRRVLFQNIRTKPLRELLFETATTSRTTTKARYSASAKSLMIALTEKNPQSRLGSRRTKDIRTHAFFVALDFAWLADKEKYVPVPMLRELLASLTLTRAAKG